MSSSIEEIFADYFIDYVKRTNQTSLRYVVTSTYREGNRKTNPHAVKGNAMDFTLRLHDDYAPIKYYNELFLDLMTYWPFRAGIDNTYGNIHIHTDMGEVRPEGQLMPYFFKEEDGKFTHRIKIDGDLNS